MTSGPENQNQRSVADSPPEAETLVKGLAFRTNVDCFIELFGSSTKLLEVCPSELRDALVYQRIVRGGWYPISWYRHLLEAMVTVSESPAEELMLKLGALASERDINGVYRALCKALKPATILGLYARLFSKYYSQGKFTVISETMRSCRIQLTECHGFDRNMYVEILGSARYLMGLTGA